MRRNAPTCLEKHLENKVRGLLKNTETEDYAEHPWAKTENAKHAIVPRHAIFHFGLKQTCD